MAVKVLSDAGSGTYSNIVSGVDWAYGQFQASRKPSIATMSLGGAPSNALDSAVSAVGLFTHTLRYLSDRIWRVTIGHSWRVAHHRRRVELNFNHFSSPLILILC